MKKTLYCTLWLCLALLFAGCQKDEPSDNSIFDTHERNRGEFDKWILENYTLPYNIDLLYRMEDIEAPLKYTLAPAELDKSKKLARIVKFLWLDAYDEAVGIDFTRKYVPKMLHFIGSGAYDNQNTVVLGTAEGGLKVTLFAVNNLVIDPAVLNSRYFKTMHHEFAHILHQTKNYDASFQLISESDYVLGDWYLYSASVAAQLGFVSSYARHSPNEDFVETFSVFVVNTPEYWEGLLASAGTSGAEIIQQKFSIVSNYMLNVWKIDMYELRNIVQRRSKELFLLDLDN